MVVQHNMQAANASRMLNVTTGQQSKTTEKLASGYKINRAADDAAGLSISEKMRKQIRGLEQASTNAQDGVSAVQTAEGALTEVHSMLQRMNELAVQAANGTNSEADRSSIQDEINQLTTEIDRVAETTKFNESYLLKGGKGSQTNTLKGHDAGIDGTFVDGSKTATLKVNLAVGTSIKIGGQDYNIVSDESTAASTAKDSLSKLQDDIKSLAKNGSKVTINGTEYTGTQSGSDPIKFDAGTGTTYSADELAGMVKDGTTVIIDGKDENSNAVQSDPTTGASPKAQSVIARDFTDKSNITAEAAAKKIAQALKQANDIGATASQSDVKASLNVHTAASSTLLYLSNNSATQIAAGTAIDETKESKVTAKTAMIAFDSTTNTRVDIAIGDNITKYYTDSNYKFYSNAAKTGNLLDIDTVNHKSNKEYLIEHDDALVKGIAGVLAEGDSTAAGQTRFGTDDTLDANYNAYEKVDVKANVNFVNVTHEAGGNLDAADKVDVSFTAITTTSKEDAEAMKAGQDALIADLKAGKISLNVTSTTTPGTYQAKFSHNGNLSEGLDLAEDGTVKYNGTTIATLDGTKAASAADAAYAAGAGDKSYVKALGTGTTTFTEAWVASHDVGASDSHTGDEYTFEIKKGTTEVANSFSLNLHVGSDADMTNKISIGVSSMTSEALGIQGINVSDDSGMSATYAVDAIEDAIKTVSAQRSALGAVQNRLEHTIANVDNVVENSTAAESRIRDTDMADEMVKYSKNNILAQAGQSMLAQANQSTQGVLSILG